MRDGEPRHRKILWSPISNADYAAATFWVLSRLRRNWHPVTHAALMSQLNLSERLPDELAGRLLHGAETARTEERVVHTDGRA